MTTYRSEADFEERFGRDVEPDGRPSIVSYLDHQGRKLVERFDPATYRILAGAMDRHDIGVGWGGATRAYARLADGGTRLTGSASWTTSCTDRARSMRWSTTRGRPACRRDYREIRSTKGHDAFLVEWDQLTDILRGGARAE